MELVHNMNDKVQRFRQQALEQGYSPQEIDSFIAQQTTQQPVPQKDFASQIGEGAINLGKSMAKPFVKTGQNIGTAAITVPQAVLASLVSRVNAETGAKIASKDILGTQKKAEEVSKDPTKALVDQAKASAGVAAWAVPFGKGAGLMRGTLVPGAKVGALHSISEEDSTLESVLGGAVLGAGGAGVLKGATALPGFIRGLGKGGEKAAESLMLSNFTLPGGSGRTATLVNRLKPEETVREILKHNAPTTLNGMQQFTQKITGPNGIISRAIRNLAGKANREIDVGVITTRTKALLDKSGIPTKRSKEVQRAISMHLAERPGKIPGRISVDDALDVSRSLQKEGIGWLAGDTPLSPNPISRKIGQAYLAAADELMLGINKAVPDTAFQSIRTALAQEAGAISPRLQNQILNAKSFSGLRSVAAPFVRLSQMVELTKNYQMGALTKAGTSATARLAGAGGGFAAGGVPGAVVGTVAAPLLDTAATAASTPLRTGTAKLMQGGANMLSKTPSLPSISPYISGQLGSRAGVELGSGGQEGLPPIPGSEGDSYNVYGQDNQQISQGLNPPIGGELPPLEQNYITGYSPEQLYHGYLAAMNAGDKASAGALRQMFQDEVKWQESQSKKTKANPQIQATMSILDQLEGLYGELEQQGHTRMSPFDVGGVVRGWYAGKTQTGSSAAIYDDLRRAYITNVARALGERGNIPEKAIERMIDSLPKISDTAPIARRKFQLVRQVLAASADASTSDDDIMRMINSMTTNQLPNIEEEELSW
jgi:hypothetical protein